MIRPLAYFAMCGGLLAATVAARFLLARFIPQPETDTLTDRSN